MNTKKYAFNRTYEPKEINSYLEKNNLEVENKIKIKHHGGVSKTCYIIKRKEDK